MRFVLLLVILATCSACTGAETALPTGPDVAPSALALASVGDSLASAATPDRRHALAVRVLQRAGLTPLADFGRERAENPRFRANGVLAGLIPGRHPLARTELVLLGTEVDGPSVAAVLEAARVLVERSKWATVPERTVMVALWSGPRGVEKAIEAGIWPRADIRTVISVGETSVRVPDVVPIQIAPGTDALELAQSILDATIREARRPAPVDTTSAP